MIVPNFLPDVPRVREDLAEYYQSVSRFDQVVGAVLSELDASGRADETLLFVTTDHAMPFPGAKASSFDSGHRCPLIVVSPAQRSRSIRNQAVMSWPLRLLSDESCSRTASGAASMRAIRKARTRSPAARSCRFWS